MLINDFLQKFAHTGTFRKKSRLLVVPNYQEEFLIRKNFENDTAVSLVRISDCISRNDFVLPPSRLFSILKGKIQSINQHDHIAVVLGLDAMFKLWDFTQNEEVYRLIQEILDAIEFNCLFITNHFGNTAQKVFSHPKYESEKLILHIGTETPSIDGITKINLISKEFSSYPVPGVLMGSIQNFLKEYENGTVNEGVINILVDCTSTRFAGVNTAISQIFTKSDFLKNFCSLHHDFSTNAINWLYDKMKEEKSSESVLNFSQKYFFPKGLTSSEVLINAPNIIRLSQPEEREIILQLLRLSLTDDSYLRVVLNDLNMDEKDFTEFYVCEILNLITNNSISDYAIERKKAIEKIGVELLDGEIATFIKRTKEYPFEQIVALLNTGTQMEKHELIRRIMDNNKDDILPICYNSYPLLQSYMEPYDFGNIELNNYFESYRLQKIKNRVNESFCRDALNINYPPLGIDSRDELVKQYSKEADTCLLVVDALGAEYMPMLLSLANKRSLGISFSKIAYSKLPTTTASNPIEWDKERKLPDIKLFDAVIHNGKELHVVHPDEENFVALLEIFESNILPAVTKALTKYSQVILTSDHGASRLAICAYKQKQFQDIPLPEPNQPVDWRYTTAIPGKLPPNGSIESLSGTYWIIKGYNRFPKKGGKLHELHGGATYEECLVPFIVFKNEAKFMPKIQKIQNNVSEFIENSDFDL